MAPIARVKRRLFPAKQNGFGASRHFGELSHHACSVEFGKLREIEFAVPVVRDGLEPAARRERLVDLVAG